MDASKTTKSTKILVLENFRLYGNDYFLFRVDKKVSFDHAYGSSLAAVKS